MTEFNYLRPDADDADGNWTNELDTNLLLYQSVDETVADDGDYVKSEENPAADVVRFRLSNPTYTTAPPAKLRIRFKRSGTGIIDLTVRVLEGTTPIVEWVYTDIADSFVDVEETLTSGEYAAITDFTNLFVELEASESTDWWLEDSVIDLDFENGQYYNAYRPSEPVDSDLVLLIHGDGSVYDSTGHVGLEYGLTPPRADTSQSKFGGSSVKHDGGYTQVNTGGSYAFGTGDFTVDAWLRYTAGGGGDNIVYYNNDAGAGQLHWSLGTSFSMHVSNGDGNHATSTTLSADTWYHIAITRSAGVTSMWLNGVLDNTPFADTNNYTDPGIAIIGTGFAPAWLDEIRVLKGTAAWTSNFTPPSAPYTPAALQGAATNSLAADTVLMLHGNGVDGSSNVSDSTGRHFVTSGPNQIDTAQSKFGGASILFNGGAGTHGLDLASAADLTFGTGDYTVDFWWRPSVLATFDRGLLTFDTGTLSGRIVRLTWSTSGNLVVANHTGAIINVAAGLSVDTWYHIALTRSGTDTRLFLNGTQLGATATGDNYDYPFLQEIGSYASNFTNEGWMDEIRVIKGVAAWTANFTPPAAPYDVGIGPYDELSCSRASIGYAQTVAGTLTQFAANQLRITDQGLLIEDARTNVLSQSQALNDATEWSPSITGITVTDNSAAAPDGTTTAAQLLVGSGGTLHREFQLVDTAVGTCTWSVYFKAGTSNFGVLTAINVAVDRYAVVVNLTTGAVTDTNSVGSPPSPSSKVEMLADGWLRVSITMGGDASYFQISMSNSATPTWDGAASPTYSGNGTDTIYAWGAQVEAGAFASSYIPTTTAAATRAADAAPTAGTLASVFQDTDVSLVVDSKLNTDPANLVSPRLVGAASARFDTPLFANTNTVVGMYNEATGALTATLGAGTFTGGVKVGSAWSGANRSVVGGGGTVASDANGRVLIAPPLVGNSYSLSDNAANAYIRRLTVWNTKLADATLQGFTAP